MQPAQFKELLKRYLDKECTAEENAFVENWYNRHKVENPARLTDEEYITDVQLIHKALEEDRPRQKQLWFRIAAAAVILFTLSTFLILYYNGKGGLSYGNENATEILPGTDKAMLTLSDGSQISLSDAKSGEIATESGLKISKSDKGEVVYSHLPGAKPEKDSFNTIETPRGGKYQIILPDGTMVWLDAASSLRYPVAFNGKERSVELTGQAYFEVAKIKGKSFKVISGAQELEVLGTHFNVNAYTGKQPILTTLLEGSVKVVAKGSTSAEVLKPGQQSALEGRDFQVKEVDTEEAIAWKNGLFIFNEEDVPTVLLKLERWYDVDFITEGELEQIKIGGKISRSKTLSEVLRVLQLTRKIKFKTEGRRITAMP